MNISVHRTMAGVTLIELMVGMAVGLIMMAAVVALMTSMLRTNAETVTVARVTQEGRSMADLMSRELRRARYSGDYLQFVGAGATVTNNFGEINILDSGKCIRFSYDADEDGDVGAESADLEVKVISLRADNAIYFGQYQSYAAATCTAGALKVSSPEVQVSSLVFTRDTATSPNRIDIAFRLNLAGNTDVVRQFDQHIQIRNPFI